MLLAIAGLLLSLPKLRYDIKLLVLYYFIGAYWVGTALFYILARFRMPLLPLLAVAATIAVEWLIRYHRDRRKILHATAALLVGYFICYRSYDLYRHYLEAAMMRLTRPDGITVRLAANRYMLLDNGPLTFGGWGAIPLKPGTSVKKVFSRLPNGTVKQLTVKLPLVASRAGNAVILVNGIREIISFSRSGLKYFTFKLPLSKPGQITLQYISSTMPLSIIMDYQRNYGRTLLNGEPVQAELVCRLYDTIEGETLK